MSKSPAAVQDDELLVDEEMGDEEAFVAYDIATYPSDLTLSVVHEMWERGDIEVPPFQRKYVWSITQASLLIESFLLGLPVPQVFFYVDEQNRNQVIDGQQRIMTVVYFLDGYFGEEHQDSKRQVFRLSGLSDRSPFFKKTFGEIDPSAQRKFRSAVLRSINIRQLHPRGEANSVYHIFERLNTGGTPLKPQEIRHCVYRGQLVTELQRLNRDENWRRIIGKASLDKHQKDVELVLRVFSLWGYEDAYEKPMKEFLNTVMGKEKSGGSERVRDFSERFAEVTSFVVEKLGERPCHLRGRLNSSALDALMATAMTYYPNLPEDLSARYAELKRDPEFIKTTYISTSDASIVKARMETTRQYLVG